MRTEDRWQGFWARLEAKGDPAPHYRELAARYSEPHRAYHTLSHINHCLDEFESARDLARDAAAIETAIWFHDAVYDPRRADNEEKSAELAAGFARNAGRSEDFVRNVAEMIRASTHRSAPDDPDIRLFSDIDLSILGQPEAEFDEYERQVRREYSWVPESAFRAGRSGILRSFLERANIFGTGLFREKYEKAARINVERSLRRLK